MSAAPEPLHLESVTDSRNQIFVRSFDDNRNVHHSHPLGSNKVEGYPVFTFAPHKQPNAQFYCTYNEIQDCHIEDAKFPPPLEADASDGLHKRDSELPIKAAAEVAAAARFISKVDTVPIDTKSLPNSPTRPRLGSLTIVRDSIIDSPLKNPRSRPSTMPAPFMSNRSKATRPPPLQLEKSIQMSEEIQTPLPTRSSSKGAPSFDIARPLNSAALSPHSAVSPGLASEPRTPLAILTAENASTFQFDFSFSTEPPLSRSASDATTESMSPQTPCTDAADEDLDPMQEQIRKDFEEFALGHGPYLRGSSRRMRRLPIMKVYDDKEDGDILPSVSSPHSSPNQDEAETTECVVKSFMQEAETHQEFDPNSVSEQQQRSSGFRWSQKKPEVEVDDLIDLYLTEEQKEEIDVVKQAASNSKVTLFRNRIITDPLPFRGG